MPVYGVLAGAISPASYYYSIKIRRGAALARPLSSDPPEGLKPAGTYGTGCGSCASGRPQANTDTMRRKRTPRPPAGGREPLPKTSILKYSDTQNG